MKKSKKERLNYIQPVEHIDETMRSKIESFQSGTLYIVPTPIGNLDDITLRAIKVLNFVDIIACEDTRHTGILLKELNISFNRLLSYHEHNESERASQLINELKSGKNVAIVADAGTPGISDPGNKIISLAIENRMRMEVLPGATALIPAYIGSGFSQKKSALQNTEFVFVGFPPSKKGRQSFLKKTLSYNCVVILYESPHRIDKLIRELHSILDNNRRICIAREISKLYEEYIRGTIEEVEAVIKKKKLKGEMVVIIEGVS